MTSKLYFGASTTDSNSETNAFQAFKVHNKAMLTICLNMICLMLFSFFLSFAAATNASARIFHAISRFGGWAFCCTVEIVKRA